MMEYKTLEKTDKKLIYKAFLNAFSDYSVNLNLSFESFEETLKRRGYISEISIGAFDKDKLVGFILNGCRNYNGKKTMYDITTGVTIEYRRLGIAREMLEKAKEIAYEKNVEQYVLEAIDINRKAVKIYKSAGFKIERNYICFEIDKKDYTDYKNHKVEKVKNIDLEKLKEFWDFKPSWQNSIESINAVPESFEYVAVKKENEIIGYGIINKKTGDIPQIAVKKEYRECGVGKSIIINLIKNTDSEKIAIVNIEGNSKDIIEFLTRLNFENVEKQYEMILKLK